MTMRNGAGWFDKQSFVDMAFDGNDLVVYDLIRRARDTAVGSYVCR